jgi:hypothetical protein
LDNALCLAFAAGDDHLDIGAILFIFGVAYSASSQDGALALRLFFLSLSDLSP